MKYSLGAEKSPLDVRTFKYKGDKAGEIPNTVGESWADTEFIEDQHRVGICSSISMTMKARKFFGIDFSDDFQYLLQKKFIDGNWNEGSSAFSACKVGKNYGFLPESEWTHTTIEDRKLTYNQYIKKLQSISDEEIDRLLAISLKYKIKAYAKLVNNINALASAIYENGSVIARFVVGDEWWTAPIEPLRKSSSPISGHLVNITKRAGWSGRIGNSWGKEWADGGTAYFRYDTNPPTEMWQIWFADVPKEIEEQQISKEKLRGQILDLIQKLLVLLKLI